MTEFDYSDIPDIDVTGDDQDDATSSGAHYSTLLQFLSQSSEMRQTAKSSLQQSLYAGTGAFVGSFLGGPVGGLIGGIGGSVLGFVKGDDYDGAIVAIYKLDNERRQRLMAEVISILQTAGTVTQSIGTAEAFREALHHYGSNDSVRNGVWKACLDAVRR